MICRLHLITNPKGGVGDNMGLAGVATEFLGKYGIETCLHRTEYAGHGFELAKEITCREGDGICGIGGDGTMHEIINGLMKRGDGPNVPLSLLPGGTGNSFLRDLGLLDPKSVLERIVANERRFIDLFEVVTGDCRRYGFNIVGWGLFSAANKMAESLRFFGKRRYDIAALVGILINRQYRGELEFDGKSLEGGFTLLAASNTIHTGEGLPIAPEAKLDDGKLDLLILRNASRLGLLRLFSKLRSGSHVGEPGVEYLQVSEFKLSTDEALPLNLDGELIDPGPCEVRVLPSLLELLL
jgi:diacylglycerol kinase (ATP)